MKHNVVLIYDSVSISDQLSAIMAAVSKKKHDAFLSAVKEEGEQELTFNVYVIKDDVTVACIKTVEACLYQCYCIMYECIEKYYGMDRMQWANVNIYFWAFQNTKARHEIQQDAANLEISKEARKLSYLSGTCFFIMFVYSCCMSEIWIF
jgi:hypothetical protein